MIDAHLRGHPLAVVVLDYRVLPGLPDPPRRHTEHFLRLGEKAQYLHALRRTVEATGARVTTEEGVVAIRPALTLA